MPYLRIEICRNGGSITFTEHGPRDVGSKVLAADNTARKGFDLDTTLGGDGPDAIPPLTDSSGSDAESVSGPSEPSEVPNCQDDSGVDDPIHNPDTKAILCSRQALLRKQDSAQTPALDENEQSNVASSKTAEESSLLAERLRAAFAVFEKSRASAIKNAICVELGISRQAIDGWLRTGRIGKTRLAVLAKHTGQSLDFFLGQADMTAQEQAEVELVLRFRALPEALRSKLLSDAQAYAALLEQSQPPSAPKPGRKK